MKNNNSIYYWLLSGCALIALMVVIGGITRLTQSGLSMVEWKPIVGAIPPLNEKEWLLEFEKYKTSPEYAAFHSHFTLSDFKSIFFWEYLHRLLGRIVGLVFIIPCVIFWVKKKFSPEFKKKVAIIFLLGLLQGFLGWFMVKSGLVKNPHVSHYRLAAHLVTALVLIAYIYYTALGVKHGFNQNKNSFLLRKLVNVFLVVLFLQITYGAFVAGLKAGFVYNTFPKMGEVWIPSDFSTAFNKQGMFTWIEYGGIVQLIHRLLAFIVLFFAVYIFFVSKRNRASQLIKNTSLVLLIAVSSQVLLGVFTLINAVPLVLGVAHQAVAIFLILITIRLKYNLNQTVFNGNP